MINVIHYSVFIDLIIILYTYCTLKVPTNTMLMLRALTVFVETDILYENVHHNME